MRHARRPHRGTRGAADRRRSRVVVGESRQGAVGVARVRGVRVGATGAGFLRAGGGRLVPAGRPGLPRACGVRGVQARRPHVGALTELVLDKDVEAAAELRDPVDPPRPRCRRQIRRRAPRVGVDCRADEELAGYPADDELQVAIQVLLAPTRPVLDSLFDDGEHRVWLIKDDRLGGGAGNERDRDEVRIRSWVRHELPAIRLARHQRVDGVTGRSARTAETGRSPRARSRRDSPPSREAGWPRETRRILTFEPAGARPGARGRPPPRAGWAPTWADWGDTRPR